MYQSCEFDIFQFYCYLEMNQQSKSVKIRLFFMEYIKKGLSIIEMIYHKKTFTWGLTFIAKFISPPRVTRETSSTLYVTRAFFTISRTRDVTFTAIETGIITSWIKSK